VRVPDRGRVTEVTAGVRTLPLIGTAGVVHEADPTRGSACHGLPPRSGQVLAIRLPETARHSILRGEWQRMKPVDPIAP
jgi:hypothetical protein